MTMKAASIRLLLLALTMAALLPNLPVNCLSIGDGRTTLFSAPVSLGAPFVTEYVHSVQLTPVIDEYRILQGRLWSWEERVQSHNAGLPYDAPPRGRFILAPPWMIVRGGGIGTERIVYRIGTAELGRNLWRLPPYEDIEAYAILPSARVFIETSVERLKDAMVRGFRRPM